MSSESLRNIDLNLMVAFSTLLRERSVSRAAARLFIGQSGMSGALARLRALFDDPLLVRVGQRLEPTPRALALVAEVDQALVQIERAVGTAKAFDPATSTRSFTLAMTDNHELLFGARLAKAVFAAAPRARLILKDVHVHSMRSVLDETEVDVVVSVALEVPSWHRAEPLFEQETACLWAPAQLPRLGARRPTRKLPRLTLAQYTSVDHALVTYKGDLVGSVDKALAAEGHRRNVVVGVSRFAALPEMLHARPLVATVPTLTARRFAKDHALAMALPPIKISSREVCLVYRERDAALPELVWLRELVRSTVLAVAQAET